MQTTKPAQRIGSRPSRASTAAKLVKRGIVATLGMPYHARMPLFPGRTWALSIPGGGTPTHDLPWGDPGTRQTFMDELLTAEVGQAGTQFDALTHPMIKITGREAQGWKDGNYMYNGVRLEDVGGPRGLTKNGPENVGSFFTRGILIDIAALKGVERLPKGYSITLADYRDALARQGIGDAEQGNVVLIRTGWDQLWKNNMAKPADQAQRDNTEANSGEPGASAEVCDHLAGRKGLGARHGQLGHRALRLCQGAADLDQGMGLLPHEPNHPARHLLA